MKPTLKDRLNQISLRLQDKDVLSGAGLGNEIGFYIFDYPAEQELEVRNHLCAVLDILAKKRPDLRLAHINLFELIIGYLKDRNLLDRARKLQRDKGDAASKRRWHQADDHGPQGSDRFGQAVAGSRHCG